MPPARIIVALLEPSIRLTEPKIVVTLERANVNREKYFFFLENRMSCSTVYQTNISSDFDSRCQAGRGIHVSSKIYIKIRFRD